MKTINNRPTLTVAIPSYNVESFLEECVNSLLISIDNANKLEILIINDGSTDNTLEVAKILSKKHKPVNLINKKNGGHGSTINIGLNNAKGKYFKLLDGDDFLNTSNIQEFISILENTNADIILTDYVENYYQTKKIKNIKNYTNFKEFTVYNKTTAPFDNKGPLLSTTTFKTSLFKQNPFRIDEKSYYVDMEYNLFTYLRSSTFMYINMPLYFYRLERDGQSMQHESMIKNHKQHEKVILRLCTELKEIKYSQKDLFSYEFLKKSLYHPMVLSHFQLLTEKNKSAKDFRNFIRNLKKCEAADFDIDTYGKIIKLHSKFYGLSLPLNPFLRYLSERNKKQ